MTSSEDNQTPAAVDSTPAAAGRPTLDSLGLDVDGTPTLAGSAWSRVLVDGTSCEVLCAWDQDGNFHQWGTGEQIAELVFSIQPVPVVNVQKVVRGWVRDVAYAEEDFVVDGEEVVTLLDTLDPGWRIAFQEREP